MNPKVFISHASEDKERFVMDFATKLYERGIDAWVDKWEMYPGDSLIDKVFEEGIKNAQAVIIILSQYSVDKPWVREELNASMIKKINDKSKLIPVIIDDCKIPMILQSTVWERIQSLQQYDDEFERIVMSIYGHRDKPVLGIPPQYAQTVIDILPGLNKLDSLILKASVEMFINNQGSIISTESFISSLNQLNIPKEEMYDSLEILDSKGYIDGTRTIGSRVFPLYGITLFGFETYARKFITNYDKIIEQVVFTIVNQKLDCTGKLQRALNYPLVIINHIIKTLGNKGLVKFSETIGSDMYIYYISPELKRILREK